MCKNTNNISENIISDENSVQKPLFNLSSIRNKPVEVSFSSEKISSDGGLLLLKEIENQIGIIDAITSCIKDTRHQGYVDHSIYSLVAQRVFAQGTSIV